MKDRVTERRERFLHLLVYLPSGCNDQGWVSEARSQDNFFKWENQVNKHNFGVKQSNVITH